MFNSRQFSYDKNTKLFTAFASDLTEGGSKPLMNRATRSLTMVSGKTNAKADFLLNHIEVDGENDTQYWDFKCVDACSNAYDCVVRVFND